LNGDLRANQNDLPAVADLTILVDRPLPFTIEGGSMAGKKTKRKSLSKQMAIAESTDLIRVAQLKPELEYMFRHALIQDAAYNSLLKADRRTLHQGVGEAIEQLYPDRHDELAGHLALHFEAAGITDKAVSYYLIAARRAEGSYAYQEASQYLKSALELVKSEPTSTQLTVLEQLAHVLFLLKQSRSAISYFQQGLAVWRSLPEPDPQAEMRLHRQIIDTLIEMKWRASFADFEAALPELDASRERLIELVQDIDSAPPDRAAARCLTTLAWSEGWLSGDWEASLTYSRAALRVAEQLDAPIEISAALGTLGLYYEAQGHLQERAETALRRLAQSEDPRFTDLRARSEMLVEVGGALISIGQYAQAVPHLIEGERLSEKLQNIAMQEAALALQLQCWYFLDRWDDLMAVQEKRWELQRTHPQELLGANCFGIALVSAVYARRGLNQQAAALRDEAYDIMVGVSGGESNWARQQYY
jgi:tetratricopeptide (TPR) repeat protein